LDTSNSHLQPSTSASEPTRAKGNEQTKCVPPVTGRGGHEKRTGADETIQALIGGTGQLRRDNRVIYVLHHAALEVAAPARPRPPRQQPGLRRAAPRPGQRQHRVDVRVPEPREQARRRHCGAQQERRRPAEPLPRLLLLLLLPAAAEAGHSEAPVVPPPPVRLHAAARLRHEAGHGHGDSFCAARLGRTTDGFNVTAEDVRLYSTGKDPSVADQII
jgi:hypothetical protein